MVGLWLIFVFPLQRIGFVNIFRFKVRVHIINLCFSSRLIPPKNWNCIRHLVDKTKDIFVFHSINQINYEQNILNSQTKKVRSNDKQIKIRWFRNHNIIEIVHDHFIFNLYITPLGGNQDSLSSKNNFDFHWLLFITICNPL